MIRVHVIITTYNRPDYYADLVDVLTDSHLDIHAWNDGSTMSYPEYDRVTMHRLPHHGRTAYGALVHRAFKHAAASLWDRVLMIPDDVTYRGRAGVARRCESAFRALADPNAIILNPLVDQRGHVRQWGGPYPIRVGNAWLTGWNDLCFYGDERLRPLMRGRFEPPGPNVAGSGVGRQWTRRLREVGNLWQIDRTLFDHRAGPSMMCPAERARNPL